MLADDEMYGAQPVVGFDDMAAAVATVQKLDVGAMHDKVVRPLRSPTCVYCTLPVRYGPRIPV